MSHATKRVVRYSYAWSVVHGLTAGLTAQVPEEEEEAHDTEPEAEEPPAKAPRRGAASGKAPAAKAKGRPSSQTKPAMKSSGARPAKPPPPKRYVAQSTLWLFPGSLAYEVMWVLCVMQMARAMLQLYCTRTAQNSTTKWCFTRQEHGPVQEACGDIQGVPISGAQIGAPGPGHQQGRHGGVREPGGGHVRAHRARGRAPAADLRYAPMLHPPHCIMSCPSVTNGPCRRLCVCYLCLGTHRAVILGCLHGLWEASSQMCLSL